ncbi:ORF73 [Agrotis segetum granulovirus]|uniref:ORF73 n=1 Tax=Agrotis segetum granulosis virus TaxID=10464 RepID=Q6QXN4_GVAS|nr:hypothetical protein AsGV087 [Agrotis segetum granulovirus]AAS82665.1 ORF73 [Agrotis segetum granulovirus]AHN92125.1 hypothetical protein AsGV086 [Agrotis segetum granulovirus]AKN63361.1 hypothetical protein AsGV087 [Agrotis segetum granulovirus]
MENSLFTTPAPAPIAPNAPTDGSEEVLQALLQQNVGNIIRNDQSVGKKGVLQRLFPKTRGLKRLIDGIDEEREKLLVRGADEAVDTLEVLIDIVNGAFVIQDSTSV